MATDLQKSFEFIHSFEKEFNAPGDRVALEARLRGMGLMPNTEEYCRGALDRYAKFLLPNKGQKPKAGWPVCYSVETERKDEEMRKKIATSSILERIFNCMRNILFLTRRNDANS